MLSITDLPNDIHDAIATFLPDKDLIEFVCASRHIIVSPYLLRQRQRAHWKECGVLYLAGKGDLAGLQYLHGLGGVFDMTCNTDVMDWAAQKGHLAVVQFLHSVGTPYTTEAMDLAAMEGHLAVVEFLQSVGVH